MTKALVIGPYCMGEIDVPRSIPPVWYIPGDTPREFDPGKVAYEIPARRYRRVSLDPALYIDEAVAA